MPSLSLNVGLNNGRKLPFGGGAAPSGIPVASTSQIYVTSSNSNITSEIYVKDTIYVFISSSAGYDFRLEWGGDGWYFYDYNNNNIATAVGGSAATIPTSGWTINIGSGSITVAAA